MNFQDNHNPGINKIKNAASYISSHMPSANNQHPNPIETLSLDDIKYLQQYLEQIKTKKMAVQNQENRQPHQQPQQQPHQSLQFRPNCIGHNITIPKTRANDIYNPLDREVPVPIDWRSLSKSETYPIKQSHKQTHGMLLDDDMAQLMQMMEGQAREPGSRGAACTRTGKRLGPEDVTKNRFNNPGSFNQENSFTSANQSSNGIDFSGTTHYKNPYEYGGRDNSIGPMYKQPYLGPYENNASSCSDLGLTSNMCGEQFPGSIRNINVESSLLQNESTHIPGQRKITESDYNRFELLPFDPQDHRHIVWKDDMPRGGYATRSERLELK